MKELSIWIDENENRLMEYWDEYKFDNLCGEYFHHDNVDYWNEDQFNEMCEDLYLQELEGV